MKHFICNPNSLTEFSSVSPIISFNASWKIDMGEGRNKNPLVVPQMYLQFTSTY